MCVCDDEYPGSCNVLQCHVCNMCRCNMSKHYVCFVIVIVSCVSVTVL